MSDYLIEETHEYLAEDFYESLVSVREKVYFTQLDGTEIECSLSLENKLAKSEITAINQFAFKGVIGFPTEVAVEFFRGSYFRRDLFPDKTFLVLLADKNKYDGRIFEVYITECNDTIDIGYITTGQDEIGNDVDVLNKVHEGVKAFKTRNVKTQQDTDFGSLQTSVTSFFVPANLNIDTFFKVFRKENFTELKNITDTSVDPPVTKKLPVTTKVDVSYKIESVDDALTNPLGDEIYGIVELITTKEV